LKAPAGVGNHAFLSIGGDEMDDSFGHDIMSMSSNTKGPN